MTTLENYGPVLALRQGLRIFGVLPPLMWVRSYAVDGLLIDTGLSGRAKQVLAFAREHQVLRAVITHHHEDHSGNAKTLLGAGVQVQAGEETRKRIAQGFSLHFYQWLVWGPAPRVVVAPLGDRVETERHCFQVLPAPGHCDDQVVFYEPKEGWLFSGDAFLAERIKYFREDEDFAKTVASLRLLASLPFESLFCAHRPIPKGGQQSLREKLEHLLGIEERVRALHQQGLPLSEVSKRAMGKDGGLQYYLTLGDVSRKNLARSILYGPIPRKK